MSNNQEAKKLVPFPLNFKEHPNFGKGKHRVNPDAVNHDLRRKIWDGQIPVKINLHNKEISTNK